MGGCDMGGLGSSSSWEIPRSSANAERSGMRGAYGFCHWYVMMQSKGSLVVVQWSGIKEKTVSIYGFCHVLPQKERELASLFCCMQTKYYLPLQCRISMQLIIPSIFVRSGLDTSDFCESKSEAITEASPLVQL